MTNQQKHKTMVSELKAATRKSALLVGKSKPKVKIRKVSTSSCRLMKLVISSALFIILVIWNLQRRDCRPHNETNYLQAPGPNTNRKSDDHLNELVTTNPASSELSLEYLNLRVIPSSQLCRLGFQSRLNSVSFANNQIKAINSTALECVGGLLKILNLRSNKISVVSEDAFKGLGQLQVLNLEENHLAELPWKQLADTHLPSLRHLNLARNRIKSIDANEILAGSNLISLDLRGNPLERIHSDAFSRLGRLKTLILSQIDFRSGQLNRFNGLGELRFAHLDELGDHLSTIEGQFCEPSRKLATLSLKLNRLEQVPKFSSCQGLLSLDLSYNRLRGSLAGNFSLLNHLIDLYLGHNQLEHLDESAFVGLNKLQVLELSSNRIKTVHSNAFVPVRTTLYELNIANNIQLSQLPSSGLDQLISLKSYGNHQLRKLPADFPSARLLVLTFAYHCCDYYDRPGGRQDRGRQQSDLAQHLAPIDGAPRPDAGSARRKGYDENETVEFAGRRRNVSVESDEPSESLMGRLSSLVLSKLARLWAQPRSPFSRRDDDEFRLVEDSSVAGRANNEDESASSLNMSEVVLWQAKDAASASVATADARPVDDDDEYFRAANLQLQNDHSPPLADELRNAKPETRALRERLKRQDRELVELGGRVIDELIWQASKIRSAHSEADERAIKGMVRDVAGAGPVAGPGRIWSDDLAPAPELSLRLRAELVGRALANELVRRHSATKVPAPSKWSNPSKRATAGAEVPQRGVSPSAVQCLPRPDAFQPCRDLFDSVWLRASISLVFLFAFAGNILVVVVLCSVKPSSSTSALTSIMWFNAAQSKRHIDVPRFLVINLAVADLMMAVYLGLLAFVDLSTLGEFRLHAIKWQHSTGCKLAGFLAVLSSELSVFILAIITLERNYAITNAVHLNRRLSLQKAMVIMLFGYLYALTMAILPLNGINDYRKFSVCLPLDFDPNNLTSAASLYLISLISINTLSFVLLLSCYLRMYCAIRGSQAWSTNDLKIAKRMSILVVTDFLCWSPIIFVAVLALFGSYLVGSDGLKVMVIFILPLNSVANPFLYAITTKKFKRDLALLKKRLHVEQALRGLSRFFAYLTPSFCGWLRARGMGAGKLHSAAASWTAKADTGAGNTGLEQIYSKNATRSKNNKLKKSLTEYRLAQDETRASAAKQRAKERPVRAASAVKQELLLVNQNGRSVIAHGHLARAGGPRSIQFRSTAFQPDQTVGGGPNERLAVIQCANCRGKILAESVEKGQALEQSSSDCSQLSQRAVGKPRIVLDSVEAPSDAQAAARLHSDQPDRHLLAAESNQSQKSWPLDQSVDHINSLLAQASVCRKLSASDTVNQQHRSETISDNQHLQKRARSAEKSANGSRMLSLIVSKANNLDLQHHVTLNTPPEQAFGALSVSPCQTVIAGSDSTDFKHSPDVKLASYGLLNLGAPSNRSVSACAFEWPHDVSDETRQDGQKYLLTAQPTRAVCSSCDAIRRTGSNRNRLILADDQRSDCRERVTPSNLRKSMSRPRTRSISRFVIKPIAKAWSSLQLSLQLGSGGVQAASGPKNVPTTGVGQQRTDSSNQRLTGCATQKCEPSNYRLENDREGDSDLTEREELLVDLHESSIIEDVLQMSSPKRRQLLKGRRMSRSCDVIADASTSTSAAEPTSSSFYDQNDDQRILLATINQLNSRNRLGRKHSNVDQHGELARQFSARRPNCSRCRSWSPALLDKLEDCMHQIKNRMPAFNKRRNDDASEDVANDLEKQSISDCLEREDSRESTDKQKSYSSSSHCSSSLNLSEEINDDFNEVGLDDWTRNMQKKAPPSCYGRSVTQRHRLRQQLSGNSDTLSTRTAGTTLTSLSFDSNTNIPNNISTSLESGILPTVSSLSSSTKNSTGSTSDKKS